MANPPRMGFVAVAVAAAGLAPVAGAGRAVTIDLSLAALRDAVEEECP